MIYIYHASVNALHQASIYFPTLSNDTIHRYKRYYKEKDADSFLVGRLLLREGLKNLATNNRGIDSIQYTAFGKPVLGDSRLSFNISHSGEWVVCAISKEYQVGIDLEEKKDIDFCIYTKYFTTQENAMLSSASDKKDTFYFLWTRKEAVIKADGRGLSNPLRTLEVTHDIVQINNKKWFLRDFALFPGYSLTLAHNCFEEGNIQCKQILTFDQ